MAFSALIRSMTLTFVKNIRVLAVCIVSLIQNRIRVIIRFCVDVGIDCSGWFCVDVG